MQNDAQAEVINKKRSPFKYSFQQRVVYFIFLIYAASTMPGQFCSL